jgi:hypothetical protein
MVFIITDVGEYREVQVPSVVTIGRSSSNSLKPINRSVSSQHAQIKFDYIYGTNKVEAWLEDLGSKFGTRVGSSPLEIEAVKQPVKLQFGDYMKFGDSSAYFRYVESIPLDADIPPPELIVSAPKLLTVDNKNTSLQPHQPPLLNSLTSRPQQNLLSDSNEYQVDSSLQLIDAINSPKNMYSEHIGARPTSSSKRVATSPSHSAQNMTISIKYPTEASTNQHPVSIRIDPAMREKQRRSHSNQDEFYVVDDDVESVRSNPPTSSRRPQSAGLNTKQQQTVSASSDRVIFDESDQPRYSMREVQSGTVSLDRGRDPAVSSAPRHNIQQTLSHSNNASVRNKAQSSQLSAIDEDIYCGDGALNDFAILRSSGGMKNNNRGGLVQQLGFSANSSPWKPDSLLVDRNIGPNSASRPIKALNSEGGGDFKQQLQQKSFSGRSQALSLSRENYPFVDPQRIAEPKGSTNYREDSSAIVRRSWPEDLCTPSSQLIAQFVDIILDQEIGTTLRYYESFSSDNGFDERDKVSKAQRSSRTAQPSGSNHNGRRQVYGSVLPNNISELVLSEVIAESLIENGATSNSLLNNVISELNDLLRQALLGSHMDSAHQAKTSVDFDFALEGVLCNILKSSSALLYEVCGMGIVTALASLPPPYADNDNNLPKLLRNSADSLLRIDGFIMNAFLAKESRHLHLGQKYEVVALCLSNILDKVDVCNEAIWSINQKVTNAAMEHASAKSGLFKGNLVTELEELRKLKQETDFRMKKQESARAEYMRLVINFYYFTSYY